MSDNKGTFILSETQLLRIKKWSVFNEVNVVI